MLARRNTIITVLLLSLNYRAVVGTARRAPKPRAWKNDYITVLVAPHKTPKKISLYGIIAPTRSCTIARATTACVGRFAHPFSVPTPTLLCRDVFSSLGRRRTTSADAAAARRRDYLRSDPRLIIIVIRFYFPRASCGLV